MVTLDLARLMFERSTTAMMIHRKDGLILDANHSACTLFGLVRDHLIGSDLAHLVTQCEVDDNISEGNCNGAGEGVHAFFISRPDGEKVMIEMSATSATFMEEDLTFIVMRVVDNWLGKGKGLYEHDIGFRPFVDNSLDGMVLVDSKGSVRGWNNALVKMTGIHQDNVIGKPLWNVMEQIALTKENDRAGTVEGYHQKIMDALRSRDNDLSKMNLEWDIRNLQGDVCTLRQYVFPIRKGGDIWIGGIIQDVTADVMRERRSKASEERLKAILDNIPAGVMIIGAADHNILDLNETAIELIGGPKDSIVGHHCRSIFCHSENDRCLIEENGGCGVTSEKSLLCRDGSTVPVITTVTTFMMDGQQLILESFLDLSDKIRMEEKLKKSEEVLSLLAYNLKDVIYRMEVQPQLRVLYVSPSITSLLGYTMEEIEGITDPFSIVHTEDRAKLNKIVHERKAPGTFDLPIIFRLRRKDGAYIWVDSRNTPTLNEEGHLISFQGSMRDITEDICHQEELERNIRTENMINQLSARFMNLRTAEIDEGVSKSLTEIGEFVRADRAFVFSIDNERNTIRLTHSWSADDVPQSSVFAYGMTMDDVPDIYKVLSGEDVFYSPDVRNEDRLGDISSQFLLKNGLISCFIAPSVMAGRLMGYIGFDTIDRKADWDTNDLRFLEITSKMVASVLNRKRMEERLSEEKERLAVTLRSMGDGVITTDIKGNVVMMNMAGEDLTGWRQEEAVGRSLSEVLALVRIKTRERVVEIVPRIMAAGGTVTNRESLHLMVKGGGDHIVTYSGASIRDSNGKVIGAVIIFRDVAAQIKLEEIMIKAQKLEAVGTLAGGLAHDFNNILTAVSGNISVAKLGSGLDGRGRSRLEEAERSIKRARGLTGQLLTFSKGGAPIKRVVSMASIINETAAFGLAGSNVKPHLSIAEDLYDIDADPNQISQVLNNIIVNSVEAMPDGGNLYISAVNVRLDDENLHSLPGGNYVRVAIGDDGIGVPADHLERLFDPYFTTKVKGSGLGLAIAYSIIKNHGGSMMATTGLSKGLDLIIHIPASPHSRRSSVTPLPPIVQTKRARIMIMDDEEMILDVTSELLGSIGYDVVCVTDGEAAISAYRKAKEEDDPIDLVIMDLTVPGGMGGKEAIVHLLAIDPQAKAIVSSGYSDNPVMADYARYGFKGVMPKPYLIDEMSAEIRRVLFGETY